MRKRARARVGLRVVVGKHQAGAAGKGDADAQLALVPSRIGARRLVRDALEVEIPEKAGHLVRGRARAGARVRVGVRVRVWVKVRVKVRARARARAGVRLRVRFECGLGAGWPPGWGCG